MADCPILSSGSKGRDFRTVLSLYLHCPCQSWPVAVELVTFKQLPLTLSNSSCFKRNFSNIALILPSSRASQCCGPPASYSQFCIEHTSHVCKQGFSQVWKKLDIQNPYRPCLLAWTVSWIFSHIPCTHRHWYLYSLYPIMINYFLILLHEPTMQYTKHAVWQKQLSLLEERNDAKNREGYYETWL